MIHFIIILLLLVLNLGAAPTQSQMVWYGADSANACTSGQIMVDTDATSGQRVYVCESSAWVLQGDGVGAGGGDPVLVDTVAVADASGVDLTGGTNGIDIAFNAGVSPDTATFNLDLSESPAGGELSGNLDAPTLDETGIALTSLTVGALLGVDSIDATGAVDMDYGSADITDHTFVTDGTGDAEIVLPDDSIGVNEIGDDSILESMLKAVDAAADEECLTREETTGDFEWQPCGSGSGDITDVYDCSTGDCASIALTDGDLLNASAVNNSATTEGIIIPQTTTDGSGTASGQIGLNTTTERAVIGDGTNVLPVGTFLVGGTDETSRTATFTIGAWGGPSQRGASSSPIRCTNLYAFCDAACTGGAGNLWTVTGNGDVTSDFSCTIADTATSCADDTNVEAWGDDQKPEMAFTETGTCATNGGCSWSMVCSFSDDLT